MLFPWYKQARLGLEADFRLCIRAALDRIVRHPQAHTVVKRNLRRALVDRFPYAIFYRHEGDIIRVFAVMHTSRDPKIWLARIH